jgi:hypothetical protein
LLRLMIFGTESFWVSGFWKGRDKDGDRNRDGDRDRDGVG